MADIVDMKKDGLLVYPKTHHQALEGKPLSSFTTIDLHDGLQLQLHKVGLYAQISIFKKPTSTFSSGVKTLGAIIPTEFRSEYFQILKCIAIDEDTPSWDTHYALYMNSSGKVYIYTNGCTNQNLTFYGSHMYILK